MIGKLLALVAMFKQYGPVIFQIISEVTDLLKQKQLSGMKGAVSASQLQAKTSDISKQLAEFIHTCDCSIDANAGVTPSGAQHQQTP